MRIGKIVVATETDLEKLYENALSVLERVGMHVTHETVLRRLEAYGAKVSHADRIVRMPAAVVEKAVAAMKKAVRRSLRTEGLFSQSFSVSLGDGCFFLYDYDNKTRRKATREDFVAIVRFADALPEVGSFSAPVEIGGVPIGTMVLEMQALSYIHSAKPSGVENNIPEQVKYLADMRDIVQSYRGDIGPQGNAQGVTSPLTFGDRAAELYMEGGKHGFNGGTYTMAIAGLNAPVSVEGCAVQAVAELLGSWTCLMAMDETRKVGTLVLTGTVDMRTGKPCWSSPGAIRQNSLVAAVFEHVTGLPVGLTWSWYTDASQPGYQCAVDRLMRMLAQAPQIGDISFHLGDLDGASVFSLEQAVIDLDVCRAVWELYKPARIDSEMMAVEEIERIGTTQGRTHLDTDFTLAHYRDCLWTPSVIPHDFWNVNKRGMTEEDVVREANARWRAVVAEHEPYRAPQPMVAQIERVLERARGELGGSG